MCLMITTTSAAKLDSLSMYILLWHCHLIVGKWSHVCSASSRSLSSAIDPGITFRPCIALTTAERSTMFNRRYQTQTCTKVQYNRKTQVFTCVLSQQNSTITRESFVPCPDLNSVVMLCDSCRRKLISAMFLSRTRRCQKSKESFSSEFLFLAEKLKHPSKTTQRSNTLL